jgi:hypothetical protein
MRSSLATLTFATFTLGMATAPAPTGSWERDPGCAYLDSASVHGLSESWASAVASGDVEAVTQLYSTDAILMGLQEPAVRIGQIEIAEHYSRLVPGKLTFRAENRVIESECSSAVETGIYALAVGLQSTALKAPPILVRYTVMYGYGGNAWKIIHHHMELEPNQSIPEVTPSGPIMTRLSTGSITPPSDDISLPPAAFFLPPSPPVIISPTLRLRLSTTRSETVVEPGAVASQPEPAVTAIDVPAAPAAVAAPRATSDNNAPTVAATTVPTAKVAGVAQGPSQLQVKPIPVVAGTAKRGLVDKVPSVVVTQRAVNAVGMPKPAQLGGPALRTANTKKKLPVPVPPGTATSDYKPGRWVDDRPVFDD